MKLLSDLCPGETGILSALHCTGKIRRRLLDLGVTPGVHITYLRCGLLGSPLEFYVRGYRLALRPSVAQTMYLTEAGGAVHERDYSRTRGQSKLWKNHTV